MLRLLLGPAMAAAMVMGAATGRRNADGGVLKPRGYENNDPKTDMCEIGFHASAVLDNKLWIHGGYVGYDNGTQTAAPNNYLREIDITKKFKVASRDEAPVKFLLQRDELPEISAAVLWGYGNSLLELVGQSEEADKNFPGWNAPTDDTMWEYDLPSAVWSSKDIKSPGVKTTWHPLDVNVPSLGKGFYLGNDAMSSYNWADDTWINASTPWSERDWGRMVHLPIGDRGLLVTIGGKTSGGNTPDGNLFSNIDIFNLNEAGTQNSPEGVWASTQTATAANATIGLPVPRTGACNWVVAAPDNSTFQIFMYSGARIDGSYKILRDLWVLSIPSFQWIQIDDGTVGPREPDTTHPLGREGHTCNLIENSMMIMFGGRELPNFSRPCETTAIYAYDLNKLSWVETFDPEVAAQPYNVSKAVYSVIGGDALGSGSSSQMAKINDPSLQTAFEKHLATAVKTPDEIAASNPSGTGSSSSGTGSNNSDSSSSSNTAPIVGGVIGGVVAVAGIVTAVLLFRRRSRKAKEQYSTVSTPSPRSAGAVGLAEMPSNESKDNRNLYTTDYDGAQQYQQQMIHQQYQPTHSQRAPSPPVELPTEQSRPTELPVEQPYNHR